MKKHPLIYSYVLAVLATILFQVLTVLFDQNNYGLSQEANTHLGILFSGLITALVSIIITKICLGKAYKFNFGERRFSRAFSFAWLLVIMAPLSLALLIMIPGTTGDFILPMSTAGFIFLSCLGKAYWQETIFRGLLVQNLFRSKNGQSYLIPILIPSLLFGVVHAISGGIIQGLLAACYGFFLGAVYLRTKNLSALVFAHALYEVAIAWYQTSDNEISVASTIEAWYGEGEMVLVPLIGYAFHILIYAVPMILVLMALLIVRKSKQDFMRRLWKLDTPTEETNTINAQTEQNHTSETKEQ